MNDLSTPPPADAGQPLHGAMPLWLVTHFAGPARPLCAPQHHLVFAISADDALACISDQTLVVRLATPREIAHMVGVGVRPMYARGAEPVITETEG